MIGHWQKKLLQEAQHRLKQSPNRETPQKQKKNVSFPVVDVTEITSPQIKASSRACYESDGSGQQTPVQQNQSPAQDEQDC